MPNNEQDLAVWERKLRRLRMIKMVSLIPLLGSAALLLCFGGSMLDLAFFFLVLIVGIVLPQISENQVRSHLALMKAIKALQKKSSSPE